LCQGNERRDNAAQRRPVNKPKERVTALLHAWAGGDARAQEDLLPLVYQELKRQAAAYLRRERAGHTLQPTALVHEAYLRLVGQRPNWHNRGHFFALAAQMMRRVLVDHARAHRAAKRPDPSLRVSVDKRLGTVEPQDFDLLLLDQALNELADLDVRQSRIVELYYFAGLSEEEVAGVLSVSRSTVAREWRSAKAWLYRRMRHGRAEGTAV
jgi:RNA polymerase sigma factor (TIGR02999 family)